MCSRVGGEREDEIEVGGTVPTGGGDEKDGSVGGYRTEDRFWTQASRLKVDVVNVSVDDSPVN